MRTKFVKRKRDKFKIKVRKAKTEWSGDDLAFDQD